MPYYDKGFNDGPLGSPDPPFGLKIEFKEKETIKNINYSMLKEILEKMKDGQTLILTIKKEKQPYVAISGINAAKEQSGIYKVSYPDIAITEKETIEGIEGIFDSIEVAKVAPVNTIPSKPKEKKVEPVKTEPAKKEVAVAPTLQFGEGDTKAIPKKEVTKAPVKTEDVVELLDDDETQEGTVTEQPDDENW